MKAWRFSGRRRSFGIVLTAIGVALLFQMAAPDEEWARLVAVILQGVVVLVALSTAGAQGPLMRIAGVGFLVLIAISTGILISPNQVGPVIPRLISLALVLLAPIAITIGLRDEIAEHKRVTLETVFAGLCLYLLLGLAFAFTYSLVQNISNEPFFSNFSQSDATANDFLYFSLATLTTTGYGDFTAGTEVGRALSITEALAGQIYLVTVVALLVSNLGRARATGPVIGRIGRAGEPDGPPPGNDPGRQPPV